MAKIDVPVYRSGDKVYKARMDVEVDEHGEAWLSPDQVEALERVYVLMKYSQFSDNHIRRRSQRLLRTADARISQSHGTGWIYSGTRSETGTLAYV